MVGEIGEKGRGLTTGKLQRNLGGGHSSAVSSNRSNKRGGKRKGGEQLIAKKGRLGHGSSKLSRGTGSWIHSTQSQKRGKKRARGQAVGTTHDHRWSQKTRDLGETGVLRRAKEDQKGGKRRSTRQTGVVHTWVGGEMTTRLRTSQVGYVRGAGGGGSEESSKVSKEKLLSARRGTSNGEDQRAHSDCNLTAEPTWVGGRIPIPKQKGQETSPSREKSGQRETRDLPSALM